MQIQNLKKDLKRFLFFSITAILLLWDNWLSNKHNKTKIHNKQLQMHLGKMLHYYIMLVCYFSVSVNFYKHVKDSIKRTEKIN